MVVFSSLRSSSTVGLLANIWKCRSSSATALIPTNTRMTSLYRGMASHKRVMHVTPSRFQWHKFKDSLHFYVMLGVIPLTALVFYVNVFYGPAELAETPEDYEPKPWEYYNHPIKRWFARYIYPSHQQQYEKYMHYIKQEWDKQRLRKLEDKVRTHMAERGDYQAWYYVPWTAKYIRKHRYETDFVVESSGED